MSASYQAFLRSPDASHLAADASLHYVTTTTSISQPDAIVKHLQAQGRQIEKQEETILSTVESSDGFCLETETVYLFKKGGGLILPGIDENMLADTVAVCPMVHVVSLDANGKISQIRLYWDQGTMLKQVEAIGRSGRNWPIRDGQEQIKTIKQSLQARPPTRSVAASANATNGRKNDYNNRLFATDHGTDRPPYSRNVTGVDPRETAKPEERQWGELFAGEQDAQEQPIRGNSGLRSENAPVLKGGAGKNHSSNRLFDDNDDDGYRARSPERKKVDPTKNNHFEFGDDVAPQQKTLGLRATKQASHIDFEYRDTPNKHAQRANPEQERHFGYGIDDDIKTPFKRPIVHAPRHDVESHFEMNDQPESAGKQQPLNTITNINAARRHQDMDPHFSMKNTSSPVGPNENQNLQPEPRKQTTKPRSGMHSNWDFSDMQEPAPQTKKIYKTAGDGMGGKANSRLWEIGGDDEIEQYGGRGGTKQVYKTAGNGMGGKKGTGLSWSIGDPNADF